MLWPQVDRFQQTMQAQPLGHLTPVSPLAAHDFCPTRWRPCTKRHLESAHVCGAENAARIIEKYGNPGCGASFLAAVKQNPQDNRDLQMSYKDVANLREVAAQIRYKYDADDARSVWKRVRSNMRNRLAIDAARATGRWHTKLTTHQPAHSQQIAQVAYFASHCAAIPR
jgi:hypothetical protein